MRRLTPRARQLLVISHLISSIGWLGLMLCLLALAATALYTDAPDTLRAAYRAMPLLGDALIVPLSLLSLTSGVILGLGTRWGLFTHRWVTTKFWLTLAATVASITELRARLHEAGRLALDHPTGSISAMHLGFIRYNLVIITCVALALYSTNVVVSVVKPWGRRRGA